VGAEYRLHGSRSQTARCHLQLDMAVSQVLVARPAVTLLRDDLPEGVSLHSLGDYRLRDLLRPESIFQIVSPELPSSLPTLKTLDWYPINLPMYNSNFVGRDKEMKELGDIVKQNRIVTIVGSGGIGKTRLSVHVAAELLAFYEVGVWFVDFAGITSVTSIDEADASAVGLRVLVTPDPHDSILRYLRDRTTLLVFDNCGLELLVKFSVLARPWQLSQVAANLRDRRRKNVLSSSAFTA